MRFLSLSLRNFRGVEAADVAFQPQGVTVISGPNEIGKSSLAEAIDLLFDYPDSSQAKAVTAVQPVDRDQGPVIRLEFRSGPYHATYVKRFVRDRGTELVVHQPRPESLTGRDAHDRAQAILEETVDAGLWKALRIQQGQPLDYPQLDGHGSLADALDSAAGQVKAGEAESSLFEAAKTEYEKYFTASGLVKVPLKDAAAEVDRSTARVVEIEAALQAVARDVETSARLADEIAANEAQLGDLRAREVERARALGDLEARQRELEALGSKLATSEATHGQHLLRLEARRSLVARVAATEADLALLVAALEAEAPRLAERRAAEATARERAETARAAHAAAAAAFDLSDADFEFRRAGLDHEQLSERAARIRAADAAAVHAAGVLERNRVDGAALKAIRAAHLALEVARGAAETASAEVRVEALRPTSLDVNGTVQQIAAGVEWSGRATEPVEMIIGDVARVRVFPAADSRSRAEALRAARRTYDDLLGRAGVADLDAAVHAERERGEAARVQASTDRIIEENVRDLSRAEIEARLDRLARTIEAYPAARAARIARIAEANPAALDGAADLPGTYDAAREAKHAAGLVRDAALRALTDAESAHARIAEALGNLDRSLDRRRAEADGLRRQAASENDALAAARNDSADAVLATVAEAAAREVESWAAAVAGAQRVIADADPEQVRLLAENAAAAVKSAERRLIEAKESRIRTTTRLESAGEKGLAEALAEAEAATGRAVRAKSDLDRRAAAARLLFETLRRHRDEARRAYRQPLAERIQTLGRLVFGTGFQVELGDDLTVAQRTLHGRTVPFASLSGGAREQISMIARLACAMMVAEAGGVPLLFDDALGNSDAQRLDAIGAVLAHAGRKCQVVVLTCAPDRYRNVGTAHVVALGSGEPVRQVELHA
jgi:hypothetical protein